MSDPKVEEIRARLAAATEGPWDAVLDAKRHWMLLLSESGTDDEKMLGKLNDDDDAEFIANAPTDIALLLTKLDEAEKAALRAIAAETRKKQRAYDAQAEAEIRANQAVERERVLLDNVTEAEMREQVLLAGVRELAELMSPEATLAATGFEDDGSRLTIEDVLKVTEHTVERTAKVRAILSRPAPQYPRGRKEP